MNERKLRHADMRAVLLRSKLPPNSENLLLPIKEAISNARFSCESRFGDNMARSGKIEVEIITNPFSVRVTDNGIGLDEDNYASFLTPFTGHRLHRKGKGFGRFVTLKVFQDVHYFSSYKQALNGAVKNIKFRFDVFQDEELGDTSREFSHTHRLGCTVHMETVRSEFQDVAKSISGEEVLASTLRTFLPRFLKNEMPALSITVDNATFDANSEFKEFFKADHKTDIHIEIDGKMEKIALEFSKVKRGNGFKNNSLVFLGAGRVVGDNQSLDQALGSSSFDDGENKIVYVVAASGDVLDNSVNIHRTMLEIDPDSLKTIARLAVTEILSLEEGFVKERRKEQFTDVAKILTSNPLLRRGLSGQTLENYVKANSIGWKREKFLQDLALRQFRKRRDFEADLATAFKSPESYQSMRDSILAEIEDQNKNALASYVVYRKDVLDLVEYTRGTQNDGEMAKEDAIHDIIFQRYGDSYEQDFFEHNLWLIDERLSFFSYVASDRTSSGKKRLKGEKVADLAAYDECFIYSQEKNKDVLILIEFKRPGRDDYKRGNAKSDPVEQVFATGESIREKGGFTTTQGTWTRVPEGVRIYGYVIADLTGSLKRVCEGRDMTLTWDGEGFYDYHKRFDAFVEVISYDKMIGDARKRNAAFFKILLGDLT